MLIKVCDEAAATYEYIPTTSFSKNAECFLKYVASSLQISALKYAFDELLAKHARAVNDRQRFLAKMRRLGHILGDAMVPTSESKVQKIKKNLFMQKNEEESEFFMQNEEDEILQ